MSKLRTPKDWLDWHYAKYPVPPFEQLVSAVRHEFAMVAAERLNEAAVPFHRSESTFDGCQAAGLNKGARIIEALAREGIEE